MEKAVQNWLDSAQYDLETAEYLFNSGRYVYIIFISHLAIEKLIKARFQQLTGKTPPKIHNLEYLAELAELKFPAKLKKFLVKMSNLSLCYPEDFSGVLKVFDQKSSQKFLEKAKQAFQWIKQLIQ